MERRIPTVVIAAPRSGSGKTTITISLINALKNHDMKVRAFKCGPDYIDPMFYTRILGVPSKNLDLFFTDEIRTRELFVRDNDSEISVIEGVMGLYDGCDIDSDKASTYHLARTLRAPIILVIDAHGMARSMLAEIRGFLEMDEHKLIKGVILNNISGGYYERIKSVIEKELDICVVGYFPKTQGLNIGSRHLGLMLPNEIDNLNEMIELATQKFTDNVMLEKIIGLADEFAVNVTESNLANIATSKAVNDVGNDVTSLNNCPVIAVARDEAFCFYYEDNLRCLIEAGARLEYFSPLRDEKVPENADGLLLGGGYPECYAKQLSENISMLKSIRESIEKGMPSLAECGGFMYLHKSLTDKNEETFTLAGVIDGECHYTGKLVRFGYVELNIKDTKIKAHEFHYFDSNNNGCDCKTVKASNGLVYESGHVNDNYWWGFAHLYYESNPEVARTFIKKCEEYHGKFA